MRRRVVVMGTYLDVTVSGDSRAAATAASERAIRAVAATQDRLSTWRDDSELAALNAAPAGTAVRISPQLASDLAAARRCWLVTSGAFDPGIGALVAAWGLRQGGRRPATAEIAAALAAGGMASLRLEGTVAVRQHAGVRLEEGGFGKGVALDDALRAVGGEGRAVLDLGGQLAVAPGAPIAVGIADPDRRDQAVAWVELRRGSISSTGASERGIVVAGERLGHVIDPRTGAPAPDFGSLTVWAATASEADCLSTGLYVLGPERALAWAAAHPEIGVLVLERAAAGPRARTSAGWRREVLPVEGNATPRR